MNEKTDNGNLQKNTTITVSLVPNWYAFDISRSFCHLCRTFTYERSKSAFNAMQPQVSLFSEKKGNLWY